MRRKSFYVLARRFRRFWCSSFRLRKPYSCRHETDRFGFGKKRFEKGKPAWRFLGWSSSHSRKVGRSAWLIRPCITRETRASSLVVDSGPCYHPLLSKKFYIFTDGSHTHTLPQEGEKLRSRPWDENEEEGKWKWGEDDNEMKVT